MKLSCPGASFIVLIVVILFRISLFELSLTFEGTLLNLSYCPPTLNQRFVVSHCMTQKSTSFSSFSHISQFSDIFSF